MDEKELENYALELPENEITQEWKTKTCQAFEAAGIPKNENTDAAFELLSGYIAISKQQAFLQGFEMALKLTKENSAEQLIQ